MYSLGVAALSVVKTNPSKRYAMPDHRLDALPLRFVHRRNARLPIIGRIEAG